MIDPQEASRLLESHLAWVREMQPEWKRHREMYGDEFWTKENKPRGVWYSENAIGPAGAEVTTSVSEGGVSVQVNLLRPLITSFVAPLGYQGLHFSVSPDQLAVDDSKPEDLQVGSDGIRGLLDRWYETQDSVDTTERLFMMGLLYRGGCGIRTGYDTEMVADHPLDRLWMEPAPPWEMVYDRKSRSRRAMRYIGHWRAVPVEYVERLKASMAEGDEARLPSPDIVGDGTNLVPNPGGLLEEDHVYLLELWDLTDPNGAYACYKVTDVNGGKDITSPMLEPLFGPDDNVPYRKPNGAPLVPLVPFIAEPAIERAMDSYAVVASVYELNAELNRAMSTIAEAFRRDAARILLYLKDKVPADTLAAIAKAPDMAMVAVDSETLEGAMEFIEQQPISSTILEYIGQLFNGLDREQLTADLTRGKAGKYLSATEAGALVEYSETTVGRVRKRMDETIANEAQVALWVLREEMGTKAIRIRVAGDVAEVTKDTLAKRWVIQVQDVATTPAQRAQKLADFKIVLPDLINLATTMSTPDAFGTPLYRAAAASWTHMVDMLGLGSSFTLDAIRPDGEPAPLPPPEPVQPEATPGPVEEVAPPVDDAVPLSPEEEAAMLNSPEAMALEAAAQGGA